MCQIFGLLFCVICLSIIVDLATFAATKRMIPLIIHSLMSKHHEPQPMPWVSQGLPISICFFKNSSAYLPILSIS